VDRLRLLLILATMPDEAFMWLVQSIMLVPGRANVWPDGIGGFRDESRASITAARDAARELWDRPT
jgi:hypothetical protein